MFICEKDLLKALRTPPEQLKNLRQIGPVSEYIDNFDALVVKIPRMPEKTVIELSTKGLYPELRSRVRAMKLLNLLECQHFAKLQEDISHNPRRSQGGSCYRSNDILDFSKISSAGKPITFTKGTVARPSFKKLIDKELNEKKGKKECVRCDGK